MATALPLHRARLVTGMRTLAVAMLGGFLLALAGPFSAQPAAAAGDARLPLRGAFYYEWFPQEWNQEGINPFTHYRPSAGLYSSDDTSVVRRHIAAMQYGNIQVGIASWWGLTSPIIDARFALALRSAAGTGFKWAILYEQEGYSDPTGSQIQADLTYINTRYGSDPSYLRLNGRPVIFVYSANNDDGCGLTARWRQGNTVGAYLLLKIFPGYQVCSNQPDAWFEYGPTFPALTVGTNTYVISPGFYRAGEPTPRLVRDLNRWKANIRAMVASAASFQLVTTFNEWGEGTAVESATEWATPSGFGAYLDALHYNGTTPIAPAPTPRPSPSVRASTRASPAAVATSAPMPVTPSASMSHPAPSATSGDSLLFGAMRTVPLGSATLPFGLAFLALLLWLGLRLLYWGTRR
ncbi:MAG: hypothetical protein E6I60_16180 [Chloroflexi bacterium]|nr:MAG: hypothetical protein E6I60_16180 [Chloroflexota bacterium]